MFSKSAGFKMFTVAGTIFSVAVFLFNISGVKADAAGTFSVTDYGAVADDGANDLEAIQKAIDAASDAGGGTVTFPSGDFTITLGGMNGNGYGLELKNNISLKMESNTKLTVTPNNYGNYEAVRIKGISNVSITGGQIIGDKNSHQKSGDGNDGHGIVIKDSNNVRIDSVTIKDCWGDGIYIGNLSDGSKGASNVDIYNCIVDGNRRNNIAIIHGTNVTIDKCTVKKAKGVQPQCGINIEPNTNNGSLASSQMCKNITIKNTKVTCVKKGVDNNYFALQIMNPYFQKNNNAVAKNVKIINCNLGGDVGNYAGKKVVVKKTKIKGTFYDKSKMKTKVKKCTIKNHYKF